MKTCFTCSVLPSFAGLCLHPSPFVTSFVVLTATTWQSGDLHAHLHVGWRLVCSHPALSRIHLVSVAVLGADVFDGT